MTDPEVGEVWEQCRHGNWKGTHAAHRCITLIRKLIEERAKLYASKDKALRDFGIPPEDSSDE